MSTAYHIGDIRNIALAGHGASGKTTLADALLFAAGAVDRKGSVDDGTSVCDVDEEEKRRKITIDLHLLHCGWGSKEFHLLDAPGYPDFIGNAISAIAAVENVVIAVSAPSGIEVNTRRLFQEAGKNKRGRFIVITKMDADNVDYNRALGQIRETFGTQCVPFYIPVGQGPSFSGVVDVLKSGGAEADGCPLSPADAYQMVVEQVVESDEGLMERYLEGETLSTEEVISAAHKEIAEGTLIPVLCISVRKDIGVKEVLNLIAECGLAPNECKRTVEQGDDEIEIAAKEEGDVVAQVFKVTNDVFMGKLSFLRIISGRMASDTTLTNIRTGKSQRPGHIYKLQGKKQDEVKEAIAGDIVAIAKFDDLHVSDTVSSGSNKLALPPIKFPTPMVPRAVEPKTREDEPKISAGLSKIADEDSTFTVRREAQTHELVISGMSELHLDVIQQRLKNRYKLDMNTHVPQVPYLETVSIPAEAQHRHKKQTGGRGQFADVHLRIRPRQRGEGFNFVDAIKGGVIPGQYIPAVEKGIKEQLELGVVSGNKVVDVEAEVFFGSYHDVDSSEQAFKTAARNAFKKAFMLARPALLEPIVQVEITVPIEKFGDISADLSTRRGHITGMEAVPGGMQVIQATAPLSEVLRYATDLKSMTAGQGSYTMEFKSYEPVPPNVQQQIVDKYMKSRTGEEED